MTHIYPLLKYTVLIQRATTPDIPLYTILRHQEVTFKITKCIATVPNDKHPTQVLLSITNKMQRYTIFFTTVNALHVSGSFSAHHQELKKLYTQHRVYAKLTCCYR